MSLCRSPPRSPARGPGRSLVEAAGEDRPPLVQGEVAGSRVKVPRARGGTISAKAALKRAPRGGDAHHAELVVLLPEPRKSATVAKRRPSELGISSTRKTSSEAPAEAEARGGDSPRRPGRGTAASRAEERKPAAMWQRWWRRTFTRRDRAAEVLHSP